MANSTFDPAAFMTAPVTDANETARQPIPVGDYRATVAKVEARMSSSDKGDFYILDITWDLQVSNQLRAELNLSENMPVSCRQSLFLDMNEDGSIATGPNQNIQLGRVREALGQNNAGQPWAPGMLEGAGPALVHVEQRADRNDPSLVYNDVKRVAKAN